MSKIEVTISWGEAIDKISILSNKYSRISDAEKLTEVPEKKAAFAEQLAHIRKEKTALEGAVMPLVGKDQLQDFSRYYKELLSVNETLYDLEEKKRKYMSEGKLDADFIAVCCSVARDNDKRFLIKNQINTFFNSDIVEVKTHNFNSLYGSSENIPG